MIVKKIPRPKAAFGGKSGRIFHLVNYIIKPKQEGNETCVYAAGRGFLTDSLHGRTNEMIALAAESVRSKDPVNHYVLSWQKDEKPTPEQIEEVVDIFTTQLGVNDHQSIYGLHQDTDNLHLHIAINRVHPDTGKAVVINGGFDIEVAHQAIAKIEKIQGWKQELNGRYQITGNILEHNLKENDTKSPSVQARDMEHRTGEKSAERIAIEKAGPIIKSVQSWDRLHTELMKVGMQYERKGSGAIIWVGATPIKASSVDRGASLAKLETRLGQFEPAIFSGQHTTLKPEPIKPDMPKWDEYTAERKSHYASKNAAKLILDQRISAERKVLCEQQTNQRREVFDGNWKGKGDLLNAIRSVLAAQQAAEKIALQEKHKRERENHREQFPPFPDFEQWLRDQQKPDLAEQWRYRTSVTQKLEGETAPIAQSNRDIRDYKAKIIGGQVHYLNQGKTAFVDNGKMVNIYDWRNQSTILAAMQLAAQKWPNGIMVNGTDDYKKLVAKVAAEHRFKINNPEMQTMIETEKKHIQHDRRQTMKIKQAELFTQYAEAVGADRYRVTCVKIDETGGKMGFLLDKRKDGFTSDELVKRIPEMLKQQRQDRNIYYTPISENMHHILIDDVSNGKLGKLISDGFDPAMVLESSPGNCQVILNVPKLGTPRDKIVANELTKILNQEYGDPKLTGAIHPHRAVGFENRKLKHRREDGTYPEVDLIVADKAICEKTLEMSRKIDMEKLQEQQKVERVQVARPATERATSNYTASKQAVAVFNMHFDHVKTIQSGRLGNSDYDMSRIDAMVAIRMRTTGHSKNEIEGAVRMASPAKRIEHGGQAKQDWNDYAWRTAEYAFSAKGDADVERLSKYKNLWENMEKKVFVKLEQPEQIPVQTVVQSQSRGRSR